ncbi:glycosyltransferase [Flavobacteriaceae bacterium R38]|nr:glycosyltransferase [Flavobacteriaceae bacterium R38]
MNKPKISIIIPILNEGKTINRFLTYLLHNSSINNISDIIVVDGGSIDNSKEKVSGGFPDVVLLNSEKGRAKQMNVGAQHAKGDILYFIHADSYPPKDFDKQIIETYQKGKPAGCFRMKFDHKHPVLLFSQWFTRFNHKSCRGGDQSLFVEKDLFERLNGYNEEYIICEDYDLIVRIYKNSSFKVIPNYIVTSARRYLKNGVWKLQYHFTVVHLKSFLGASPDQLYNYYKRKIAS